MFLCVSILLNSERTYASLSNPHQTRFVEKRLKRKTAEKRKTRVSLNWSSDLETTQPERKVQGSLVLSHGLSLYQRRSDDPVNRIKTRGIDEGFLLFAIAFSGP